MADTLETLEIQVKHSASGAADEITKVAEAVSRLSSALNRVPKKLRDLAAAMEVLKGKAPNISFNDNHTTQIADNITNIKQASSGARKATSDAAKGVKELSKAASKSKSPLDNFISSLKRIAFYRFIRSIIKAITQAFQEGLQNAYTFSQGITTEGHRFSEALDSMKTAGTTMKNQLGSAFIALLTAIAPVVNAIIALITRLADALSQLFAVFTGGTYLKAAEVPQQWGEAAGGAAKAAKEWKNQILGFDEINRLEEPSDGNGSGGGGAADIMSMFEDTPIDGIFKKIRDKLLELKESLDFEPLIEAWERLKESVQALGDTILNALGWAWENVLKPLAHWTIESALPTVINLLAAAFDFLGSVLTAIAPFLKETWNDFLMPIAEFVGDAFITFLQSLTDLLSDLAKLLNGELSFKEFIDQLTPLETLILAVATAFTVAYGAIGIFNGVMAICNGVALALAPVIAFLASPIGIVVAAIAVLVAAGIALYKNWDEIKAKAIETWEGIKQKWEEVKTNLSTSWNEFSTNAKQSFAETWENVKRPFVEAIDAIKDTWGKFTEWLEKKWEALKSWWQNLSLGSFHIPMPYLTVTGEFSINPPSVPHFSIDWYAQGGFPEDGLFMANHGELVGQFSNGKTAVANNEQIVEGIRQGVYEAVTAAMSNGGGSMGGNQVAVLNINGREFARAIYSDQKTVANEHGGSLIMGI